MKLNASQLGKINETLRFIIDWCDWFADQENDLLFSEERIREIGENEEDIPTIDLMFPGGYAPVEIDAEDFLELCDDIRDIQIVTPGFIKAGRSRYYIVDTAEAMKHRLWYANIGPTSYNGITVGFGEDTHIVTLAAARLRAPTLNEGETVGGYLDVEVCYPNEIDFLPPEEERHLVESYLFEIADSAQIALSFDEIRDPMEEEADPAWIEGLEELELRTLEPYNDAMKLFLSAIQTKDPELKFLNFYKILEHFSPVAVNIDANDLMRKKLDAPKFKLEDGDYIRSIFDLANSMRDRCNDEDLIKASLNTCIDFVGLFEHLPESMRKDVLRQIKQTNLTYSTESQKVTTAINMLGKTIYKTRNQVVHAKSNFVPVGNEAAFSDLPALNRFMHMASSQAIRWYSRQPSHLRQDVIG